MKRLLLAAAFCAAATPALALFGTDNPGLVTIVDPAAPNAPLGTVSHPLNTTGTFSGTISGFQPSASPNGTPVAAQTTVTAGSTQTLPTGTVVVATNIGTTNAAFCQLGATASANSQYLAPNGGWFGFTVGSATQITCVTTTSTTTVNVTGGAGIPTGTGGGGGSSGSSASVGSTGASVPASATYIGMLVAGNLTGVPGTANGLKVDGSAVTQPVSGTFFQTTQPVSIASMPTTPTSLGPDLTPITGSITANDTGTTSCTATAAGQTICTGTPTPAAVVSGAIGPAACLGVSSFVTSGAPTATLSTEFSPDNVNWLPRGLFLDGKNAPIWINNATGGVFSGQTPAAGMKYYRVRATSFSGSGTFTVTINQAQAGCVQYSGNLPTAANGSQSTGSVNVQYGGTSAIPFNTNATQQAGSTLAAPTAPGTPAVSGLVPTVNVGNPASATVTGFTPSAAGARMTPLVVGTSDSSVTLPTGAVVVVTNVGATNPMYCNVNSLAAQISDQEITPNGGWFAFTIPVGPTLLHCISPAGGTTANGIGGSGIATGTGGGGGASGSSGNVFQANAFASSSANTATTTQQFALSGSTVIYLVNYAVEMDDSGSSNFQIVAGTGTNCATSQTTLTPVWIKSVQEGNIGVLGVSAAGAALCVKTTSTNLVSWRIGVVQQ